MTTLTNMVNEISAWADRKLAGKATEAILWHRVGKIGEEHGEAIEALIALTNGNPRKPAGSITSLQAELLDVALAALCAHAHTTGNAGDSLAALGGHATGVYARAGLAEPEPEVVDLVAALRASVEAAKARREAAGR